MTNQLFRDLLDGKIHVRSREEIRRDTFRAIVFAATAAIHLVPGRITTMAAAAEHAAVQAQMMSDALGAAPTRWYPPTAQDVPLPTNPRAQALAAKQRQGTGPPSSIGWRGRERTTKFRSQS